jgi:hypothetical protein
MYIGDALEYACRSWARHLHFASGTSDSGRHVIELLKYFFSHQLLSWLEVLSIVSDLRCAVYSLCYVRAWLGEVSSITCNCDFCLLNTIGLLGSPGPV